MLPKPWKNTITTPLRFLDFFLCKIPLEFKGSRQKHWLIHRMFSNLKTLSTKAFLEETYFHFRGDLEVWCNLFSHTFFHHMNLYYLHNFLLFFKHIEFSSVFRIPHFGGMIVTRCSKKCQQGITTLLQPHLLILWTLFDWW